MVREKTHPLRTHDEPSRLAGFGSGWQPLRHTLGDTFAGQREREFRRNPVKWHPQAADGTPVDSERGGVGDYLLRGWWAPTPQGAWLFWLLVIIAALFFLNRP